MSKFEDEKISHVPVGEIFGGLLPHLRFFTVGVLLGFRLIRHHTDSLKW